MTFSRRSRKNTTFSHDGDKLVTKVGSVSSFSVFQASSFKLQAPVPHQELKIVCLAEGIHPSIRTNIRMRIILTPSVALVLFFSSTYIECFAPSILLRRARTRDPNENKNANWKRTILSSKTDDVYSGGVPSSPLLSSQRFISRGQGIVRGAKSGASAVDTVMNMAIRNMANMESDIERETESTFDRESRQRTEFEVEADFNPGNMDLTSAELDTELKAEQIMESRVEEVTQMRVELEAETVMEVSAESEVEASTESEVIEASQKENAKYAEPVPPSMTQKNSEYLENYRPENFMPTSTSARTLPTFDQIEQEAALRASTNMHTTEQQAEHKIITNVERKAEAQVEPLKEKNVVAATEAGVETSAAAASASTFIPSQQPPNQIDMSSFENEAQYKVIPGMEDHVETQVVKLIEEKVTASVEAAVERSVASGFIPAPPSPYMDAYKNTESDKKAQLDVPKDEHVVISTEEAAMERNAASSSTLPAPEPFHMSAFENEAENRIISDVERQAEWQVEAQNERDAVISAEAAAERNTASSLISPAPKPFNMGAFDNEAQNKVIAAVERQSELQVESQKERRVVASAEAAVERNLVSNFVPPSPLKAFDMSAFENKAENKVIVDVERQAELQVEAQKERKVVASAEAAVEKNTASRIIPSGSSPVTTTITLTSSNLDLRAMEQAVESTAEPTVERQAELQVEAQTERGAELSAQYAVELDVAVNFIAPSPAFVGGEVATAESPSKNDIHIESETIASTNLMVSRSVMDINSMEAAAEMKVEAQSLTETSNISAKVEGEVEINVMAAAQGTPLKNRIPDSSLLKTDLNPLEAAAQMKVEAVSKMQSSVELMTATKVESEVEKSVMATVEAAVVDNVTPQL